jgi:hyperosmotically inducible protein
MRAEKRGRTMKIRDIGLALALVLPPMVGASACATTRPATDQISDAEISSRVGRRLITDPDVKRYEVDVDTLDGVVYLRGKVDSQTMKASAERIARNTDGVRMVVNELIVDANPKNDKHKVGEGDIAVKTRVGTALSANDDIRRMNIDVDVEDGLVTLSGVVHNETERASAERIAREQEGVRDVKNDLKVEQQNPGDPEKYGKPNLGDDRKTDTLGEDNGRAPDTTGSDTKKKHHMDRADESSPY